MKIVKRVNPFGPASGAWRGPGSNKLFHYHIDSSQLIFYDWMDAALVKQLLEANGSSYEAFKEFHRAYLPAKKRFNGRRFDWFYSCEVVWDWAFQKGFGSYPAPRLTPDNQLVDENGEPWRNR